MNCGFITTHKDARSLRYEANKKKYFEGLAKQKALLHHSNKFLPNVYVDSPVLQRMETACRLNVSGICVVYCEPGLGKSAAAHLIVKNLTAGIMIGVPSNNRGGSYWDAAARKVGVPQGDDGSYGYEWSVDLVDAVADVTTEPLNQWQTFQNTVLCSPTFAPDDPPDFPAEVQATGVNARRILIFDNFDRVSEADVEFVRSFYEQAFGSKVLVLVLTQDEQTANLLLRINGWKRIRPLEGIYTANHTEGEKLPACGYFAAPTWNPLTWTANQLQALVKVHFTKFAKQALGDGRTGLDAILEHLALQNGDVPLTVIVRADRFVGEMGWAL